MITVCRFLHFIKALFAILLTFSGSITVVSLSQPVKALVSIVVTLAGISTFCK